MDQKHCQRCIPDVSQLRHHFQYCPRADIQRISFAPPPWERGTIDVTQHYDSSDSSDYEAHSDYEDHSDYENYSDFENHSDYGDPSNRGDSSDSNTYRDSGDKASACSSKASSRNCSLGKSVARNYPSCKLVISSELEYV